MNSTKQNNTTEPSLLQNRLLYDAFRREVKRFIVRMQSIWLILTMRNFILLHSCIEFEKEGKKGFGVGVKRRTDFSDKRDLYIMAGAINVAFKGLQMNIPDEVDNQFFNDKGSFTGV